MGKVTKKEVEQQLADANAQLEQANFKLTSILGRAKTVAADIRSQDKNLLGIAGQAGLEAQVTVLESIFGEL